MNDTLDAPENLSNPQVPVAPPSPAGEPQGSAPASEVTSAPDPAKPEGQEPERQTRREARAHATQRREIRDLHRQLGYMQAQMESIRSPAAPPAEGDQPPLQRQTRSPSPADEAQAEHNRSILERIEDAGEEYEAVVEKITAPSFPINVVMRDYLGEADKPAELAKWLADNPKEARRISLLSDAVAVRALERAEARLPAKAAPARTTNAPPPPPTVGGRSTPNFDPAKASMEEYAEVWHARQTKR